MKKSFALIMLMFSGVVFGESRFATGPQTAAPLREMAASAAAVTDVRPCVAQPSAPAVGPLAQRQAWHGYAQAHGELQYTLALYVQGLTTDEQLMAAERALARAESACTSHEGGPRAFESAHHLL